MVRGAGGGGQFDDAEDCENGGYTMTGSPDEEPLQSEPPRILVSHSFSIAEKPVSVVDGPTSETAKPKQSQEFATSSVVIPSTSHSLQCLVEAACASKTRTPKRVSLSPTNCAPNFSQEVPFATAPALATASGARIVSDSGHGSPDDSINDHPLQPSLSDSKTPRKSFEKRYSELQFFKKRFGHCDVLTTGDYRGLGRWVSSLRCRFRNGEVSEEQAALLRDLGCIGFGDAPRLTNANTAAAVSNENNYPRDAPSYASGYRGYHHYQPPMPPPHHFQHSLPPPKASYHSRPRLPFSDLGGVSDHPIRKLTGPPANHSFPGIPAAPASSTVPKHYVVVQPPHEADHASWLYWLNQLGFFRDQHGHTNVSTVSEQTKKRDHQDLALWLASQRNLHRKGQLHPERADILHTRFDCPGFEPGAAPTDTMPAVPMDTTITEGHAGVPTYHQRGVTRKPNMHLCDVLHAQKIYRDQCKEKSEIIAAKKASAASKPGRKRGQYVGWHERLNQLHEFRKANGHVDCRIMMHDAHKDLGRWLASQRHQFRRGKLPQDKAEILQNMGVSLTLKKPQCYRTGPNAPQFYAATQSEEASSVSEESKEALFV